MNQEETLLIFVSIQDLPQDSVDGETSSTANQTYRSKKWTDTGLSLAKLIMKQIVVFPVHSYKQTRTTNNLALNCIISAMLNVAAGTSLLRACIYRGKHTAECKNKKLRMHINKPDSASFITADGTQQPRGWGRGRVVSLTCPCVFPDQLLRNLYGDINQTGVSIVICVRVNV